MTIQPGDLAWKETVLNAHKEWHTEDGVYIVRELNYNDGTQSFQCFKRSAMDNKSHNFVGYRLTPELAKEFCESLACKE